MCRQQFTRLKVQQQRDACAYFVDILPAGTAGAVETQLDPRGQGVHVDLPGVHGDIQNSGVGPLVPQHSARKAANAYSAILARWGVQTRNTELPPRVSLRLA